MTTNCIERLKTWFHVGQRWALTKVLFLLTGLPLLCEGVFLRWNRSSKCLDEAYDVMVHIIEYNKELQNKVNSLRRQLAELETEDPLLQSP